MSINKRITSFLKNRDIQFVLLAFLLSLMAAMWSHNSFRSNQLQEEDWLSFNDYIFDNIQEAEVLIWNKAWPTATPDYYLLFIVRKPINIRDIRALSWRRDVYNLESNRYRGAWFISPCPPGQEYDLSERFRVSYLKDSRFRLLDWVRFSSIGVVFHYKYYNNSKENNSR